MRMSLSVALISESRLLSLLHDYIYGFATYRLISCNSLAYSMVLVQFCSPQDFLFFISSKSYVMTSF